MMTYPYVVDTRGLYIKKSKLIYSPLTWIPSGTPLMGNT